MVTKTSSTKLLERTLNAIERTGNRLPDASVLFVILLCMIWVLSALLAPVQFNEIDPRTGNPLRVTSLLRPSAIATFLATMVPTFTSFQPLGAVLVTMLGVGVAEHTGFLTASLKLMLSFTSPRLLTPLLILVAVISHTAADAGFIVVIPLGGMIFFAAGRHPLVGIAAAFAGVSAGFGANVIPSSIDPLLAGFTASSAQIINPDRTVNPLCNWFFTAASALVIVGVGWYITDRIIEPRLRAIPVDPDVAQTPLVELGSKERRGVRWAIASVIVGGILLALASVPENAPLRSHSGELTASNAPLMQAVVPLIFLFFLIPGIVYGYVANTIRSHRDIVQGMSNAMSTMGYYIVLAFFVSLFVAAFGRSNIGALIALKGAGLVRALSLPAQFTILGIIFLTAGVDLLIGSASAKWALLAPILVPMLMQVGISPELTQAAYRVGDSPMNVITPLTPYFPLVVAYAQRYVKNTGVGTLVSTMLPYSVSFLFVWTIFLVTFWMLGIPLGLQAPYTYP